MIFNLFGCFGNVPRLLIHQTRNYAFLEYESEVQAQLLIKYLDCIRFHGNILSIESFKQKNGMDQIFQNYSQYFTIHINDPRSFRFLFRTTESFIPPSKVLKLSGWPDNTSTSRIKSLIEKIHQPISIVPDVSENDDSNALLVRFRFLQESIDVLSTLHNTVFDDGLVFVSFVRKAK